jgi:hypothetical protein
VKKNRLFTQRPAFLYAPTPMMDAEMADLDCTKRSRFADIRVPFDMECVDEGDYMEPSVWKQTRHRGIRYFVVMHTGIQDYAAWLVNEDGSDLHAPEKLEGVKYINSRGQQLLTTENHTVEELLWHLTDYSVGANPFSERRRAGALNELTDVYLQKGVRPPGIAGRIFFALTKRPKRRYSM